VSLINYGSYRPTTKRSAIVGTMEAVVYRDGEEIELRIEYEYVPGDRDYDDCPAYDAQVWFDVLWPRDFALTANEIARIEEQICEAVTQ